MKNYSPYIIQLIILFFIFSGKSYSQNYILGTSVGLGTFTGNFPSQTTLATKVYLERELNFRILKSLKFSFIYSQKVQKFLPGNYNYNHYAYHYGFGFSGTTYQELNDNLNIEEGIGIIYQKDKSFDYLDIWNFGLLLTGGVSTKISQKLIFNVSIDYGVTLNNTTFSYVHLLAGVGWVL